MKLSVIVLNYNVRYFLELCVLSVLEAIKEIDAEIIVVDNNSTDGSCEMLENNFPGVILIKNKENKGFSKANNQGVKIAKGEFVCILNPDTVVGENTFKRLLSKRKKISNVGILGPKLIDGTGAFLKESKRNIPSPLTSFRRLFGIKIGDVKNYYADHLQENEVGAVDVLVGAFMLLTKKDYTTVAGFDEDYFMYGEDIDLSYKLGKQGRIHYYIGNSSVIHFKGESTDHNAEYIKRFYGAMRLFYKKHFKSNWILDTTVSIGIRIISFLELFKKKPKQKESVSKLFFVSTNTDTHKKIQSVLQKEMKIIQIEDLYVLEKNNERMELVFDNDYLSFEQIITWMEKLKRLDLTFRIKPKRCDYILGSDFSDGKGEVVLF